MHKVTLQTGITDPACRRGEGCGCTAGVGGICWCSGVPGGLSDPHPDWRVKKETQQLWPELTCSCVLGQPVPLPEPALLTMVTPGITAQMSLVTLHFRGYLQRKQSKVRLRGQDLERGWYRRVIPSCCHIHEAERGSDLLAWSFPTPQEPADLFTLCHVPSSLHMPP